MDKSSSNTAEFKASQVRTFCIFGEIGDDTAAALIPQLMDLEFEKEKIKKINLYICSEGGYLPQCFAIIDFITSLKYQHNLTIHTYGLGEIASGGFFLFLLGDKRDLFPSCRIFVHEHITVDEEPQTYSDRIKADKTTEKELYQIYLNYTANRLGITKQKARRLLAKNKWLSKKDIENYNILGVKNGHNK